MKTSKLYLKTHLRYLETKLEVQRFVAQAYLKTSKVADFQKKNSVAVDLRKKWSWYMRQCQVTKLEIKEVCSQLTDYQENIIA